MKKSPFWLRTDTIMLHKLNSEPVHSLTYDVLQIELFHLIIRDQIRSSRLSSLPSSVLDH